MCRRNLHAKKSRTHYLDYLINNGQIVFCCELHNIPKLYCYQLCLLEDCKLGMHNMHV